ncbi:MAG: restriction endonuclease subunit S, partial [Spirochaetia bacterium]|nr:restriction endonuclease subunit S [Spirochaetia bacterium]
IGAKKNDNGIMKKVAYDNDLITKGNCIVFICDGQGSVGYSNYMNTDFIGSTTISVGYSAKLNKYNGLFLVAILDLERPKYSYGRKYRKYLSETKIKLPVDNNGEPNWNYMENYIKALPYSDKI